MKDEKELVLFFRQGTEINNVELAANLSKEFDFLKEPVVLPFNPNNPRQPLIIFEQGIVKLTVSVSDVSFAYLKEDHKKIYDDIIKIIEYFEEEDISFERMGYVSTFLHNKKEKNKFKSQMFVDNSPIEDEFQVSWYRKELIDSVSVNVWIKGITDMINNVELILVYDINTPMNEVYNISSEFLRDFIKKCDKYIEEKEELIK